MVGWVLRYNRSSLESIFPQSAPRRYPLTRSCKPYHDDDDDDDDSDDDDDGDDDDDDDGDDDDLNSTSVSNINDDKDDFGSTALQWKE